MKNTQPYKKFATAIVVLLVVQFALGVLASMYNEISADDPASIFHQLNFVLVHALNGTALLVLGIVFLVRAIKGKLYVKQASSGLGAIVVAYVMGESFVFTQNDVFSFLMAMSFIGALLPYARIMYLQKEK